jgi:hypothetical protein
VQTQNAEVIMEEVLAGIPRGTIVIMLDDTSHCDEKWQAVVTVGHIQIGRNNHFSGATAWEALAGLVEVIRMYKTKISSRIR